MISFISCLDGLGVAAFAVSGAIAASRKGYDIVGFVVVGAATAIGGGTLRDLLIGRTPVEWMAYPSSLYIGLGCPLLVFVFLKIHGRPVNTVPGLRWADAVGLGVFSVIGCAAALEEGIHANIAAIMGALTAAGGGVIRDILCGMAPIALKEEIYVVAALAGSGSYAGMTVLGMDQTVAAVLAFAIGFGVRVVAMTRNWSLPKL